MRLMRVSYPLLTKGADLCGDDIRFTTGMALANQATLLGEDFRESAQKAYQLSDQVQVMYVVPGSAADKAGIQPGDVLKKIDNKNVSNITELLNNISRLAPGSKASALVNRKGKEIDLEIQIGKRPKPKSVR